MDLKIKDFASMQGVSDSIIYRHIRQHKDALGDRVVKRGGATWLTDEGQEYIRGLMTQQPIVVSDSATSDRLIELERENKALLEKVAVQADKIAALATWKAEQAVLLASAEQTKLALEASEKETKILEGYIADAKAEISTLQHEAIQEAQKAAQERAQLLEQARVAREAQDAAETALEALKHRSRWDRFKDVFK